MEPTRGAYFRYEAQACRLSFPSSYVHSGTPVRDLTLVALSYLSGRLGRGWSPPSFDCYSSLPFPPSFVPNFLLLLSSGPGSRYDGLAEISSKECLMFLSESRCKVSGHLLQVRVGHKASSRSFLRWCDSDFLCYFRDNPRLDWHYGSTVSPWP